MAGMNSSALERLDDQLMRWCTQFAHWFQRLTGRTSFFIAKCGLALVMWSVVVTVANYWLPLLPQKPHIAMVVVQSLVFVALLRSCIKCNEAEQSLYGGRVILPAWVMTQRAVQGLNWRLFCAIVTILTPVFLLADMDGVYAWSTTPIWLIRAGYMPGLTIFVYFIHVDPLPPGTSKVRMWVESLGFGPKTAESET